MQFKTNRLEVKPICPEDAEAVLDLLINATVAKTYMLPAYENRAQAQPLFSRLVELSAAENHYVAGIYLDGIFIGLMNDTEVKGTRIEMGYALLPAYYNQGYATEAFAGAIGYLFAHGFSMVLAGAFIENTASIRVMEKCGMVKQPHTDEIDYRGVTHTCVYYAIEKEQQNL